MAVEKPHKGWRPHSRYFGSVGRKPFAEAFPEIEKIEVVIKETDLENLELKPLTLSLNEMDDELINCRHPKCFGGGFSLGGIIREMVENKQTKESRTIPCKGSYGSKMGRSLFTRCANVFDIKISIKYRPGASSN